jgi:acyl-CoA hydrolase
VSLTPIHPSSFATSIFAALFAIKEVLVERQRNVTLRFLAEPGDVNFGGKVHGGAVMKWIDQAGYTCAAGWTGTYCVTVYLGGLHFLNPIFVGELVELRALVIRTGRRSLDIAVDVYAGDPKTGERRRTGHCVIVFVGLNSEGRAAPVPSWEPVSAIDKALEGYATRLAELRKQMDSEMEQRLQLMGATEQGA